MNQLTGEQIAALIHSPGPRSAGLTPYQMQMGVEWVFRDPEVFLKWIDDNINLAWPYADMKDYEVWAVEGENKFIRLLIIYGRKNLEPKSRIKPAPYGPIAYCSAGPRGLYIVELPRWVQILEHMEGAKPSPDFYELVNRIDDWIGEEKKIADRRKRG